jgi:hypothetical protein
MSWRRFTVVCLPSFASFNCAPCPNTHKKACLFDYGTLAENKLTCWDGTWCTGFSNVNCCVGHGGRASCPGAMCVTVGVLHVVHPMVLSFPPSHFAFDRPRTSNHFTIFISCLPIVKIDLRCNEQACTSSRTEFCCGEVRAIFV